MAQQIASTLSALQTGAQTATTAAGIQNQGISTQTGLAGLIQQLAQGQTNQQNSNIGTAIQLAGVPVALQNQDISTATSAAAAANAATDPSSLLALLAQITGSASGQANTTGAANSNFWGQIGTLLQNSGLFTTTPAPAPTPTGGN